jgi:hypothetical protein
MVHRFRGVVQQLLRIPGNRRRDCRIIRVLALVAAAMLPLAASGMAVMAPPPSIATRFFGTATLNGAPTRVVTIAASIGGVVCGYGTAQGGSYSVNIQATPVGCTVPGSKVSFTVDGVPAGQTGTLPPAPGTAVQLNLSATTTPTQVAAPLPDIITVAPEPAVSAPTAAVSAPRTVAVVSTPAASLTPAQLSAPSAPLNLQATPVDATSIRLDWISAGGSLDDYQIFDPFGRVASLQPGNTSYVITGLKPDSYYCAYVTASNVAGSARSGWACATTMSSNSLTLPGRPQNPQATALSSSSIRIDWSVAGANDDGFVIYDASSGSQVKSVPHGTTSYTLTGLDPNGEYCVLIYAVNAAGYSDPSDQVCATTLP